jgi:hypothetical protein
MAQEIERKFLVNGDYKSLSTKSTRITQGYLSSIPERTVRVRVKGDKGFITIKGIGNASGASRYEWEKEIPVEEVNELLKICEPGVIDKTRYHSIVSFLRKEFIIIAGLHYSQKKYCSYYILYINQSCHFLNILTINTCLDYLNCLSNFLSQSACP